MARVLGKELDAIPVHPRYLRDLLKRAAPAAAGISPPSWNNIRSLVWTTLRRYGLVSIPGHYRPALLPVWQQLWDSLPPGRGMRCRLSRLMHYCSCTSIRPDEVDDEVFRRFAAALHEESLVQHPRNIARAACKTWNDAARSIAGWPQTLLSAIPNPRASYALSWPQLPGSLKTEVESYLQRLAGDDPFSDCDFPPVRPATIYRRRLQLLRFASAAVLRGCPPASLFGLRELVALDVVRAGMRFFLERSGGHATSHTRDLATVLKAIARHVVRVDQEHLRELSKICKRCDPQSKGLTTKNRAILRQFDDPQNVAKLSNLPGELVRQAKRTAAAAVRDALRVQSALAIELLLMAPMRISNLAGLSLERHVSRSRLGNGDVVHIFVEPDEVKNREYLEFPLPAETVELLDLYLKHYRPRLVQGRSEFLFPGRGDRPKAAGHLGKQITRTIHQQTGLVTTAHSFRHIGAKLYLDLNPGSYELIRRVLGHKSIDTTVSNYTGLESAAAVRHFDRTILQLRAANCAVPFPRRRGA
jgi:integrase